MTKQLVVKSSIHKELKDLAHEHNIDIKDLTNAVLQKAIDDGMVDDLIAEEFQQEEGDIEEAREDLTSMLDEAIDEVDSEGTAKTTKEKLHAAAEKFVKKLGGKEIDNESEDKVEKEDGEN